MDPDQKIAALIAQLLKMGVRPAVIYMAVSEVLDLRMGDDISGGDLLVRAFAYEQVRRLSL